MDGLVLAIADLPGDLKSLFIRVNSLFSLAQVRPSTTKGTQQSCQALLVDPDTGKVDLLIYKKPPADAPNYPSPSNGYELRLY